MLKIKRAMLNGETTAETGPVGCAWVEIEKDGEGQVELVTYRFRIKNTDGQVVNCWQGRPEDVLGNLQTLRLTDGSAEAETTPLGYLPLILVADHLDLSGVRGGELILSGTNADGVAMVDTVTVPVNARFGSVLTRHPETNALVDIGQHRYGDQIR